MQCSPLAGVTVDIWHADALGVYSDVAAGIVQSTDTRGKKFLRAYQVTDELGVVQFETIYPGWYMSRTIGTTAVSDARHGCSTLTPRRCRVRARARDCVQPYPCTTSAPTVCTGPTATRDRKRSMPAAPPGAAKCAM
jgi:hypothetical protein